MSDADDIERHVISRDGTRIGFLQQGHGPGLVLVQGAMATAHHFGELARALAADFTVYRPDRRGRGLSPRPYDRTHDVARDVEDIDAVLAATGASRVFGLSSGAVITLEAARRLPRIAAAALYEPPLYDDGEFSHQGARRLGDELDRGRSAAALVTALRTARTAPPPLRALPRPLARGLAACVLYVDARRSGGGPVLRDLLPSIRYDFHVVGAVHGRRDTFTGVDTPILLLSGTDSPGFLRRSARRLADVLPRARHVRLEGLSHSGPWNTARGGHPARVAAALAPFFAHTSVGSEHTLR